ncbi:MAG: Eco47II family restriction endonuclease, partial [Clostridium sp.]
LPQIIERVVSENKEIKVPNDTVMEELTNIADMQDKKTGDLAMSVAIYLLGFSSYIGFTYNTGDTEENSLKRLYEYAKQIKN